MLGDVPVKHCALKYQRRSHRVLEHFDVIQYDWLVEHVPAVRCGKIGSVLKSAPAFVEFDVLKMWMQTNLFGYVQIVGRKGGKEKYSRQDTKL